ncbi:MAG: 1-deoxy-D-xylulose-5-phosphate synthase [Clostridiales bacterium]|nr:1-deoxy-D-xylulose-5-phosphate synthase [Clostridiales bacterium]
MEYKFLPTIHDPAALKSLSLEEISALAAEIRSFLCENVTKTGGHLASNLGVVELTIALHRVFDSPADHILFDVGHQSYVHKILTGRLADFATLRQPGGLSGFTKPSESPHDPFGAGHSSTSVSAALGFAKADRLEGSDKHTIAVLGDGAYTGGMVHEALNNCEKDLNLIIVLNENEMSISHNIGTFANQISKIRSSKSYFRTKQRITSAVRHIPLIGHMLFRRIVKAKKIVKNILYGSNCFEELGLYYLGPVDGHDYERLERVLTQAKRMGQATLVHIKTKKGKGYAPAESEPAKYHGIPPQGKSPAANFSAAFGEALVEMAKVHTDICAITAAMSDGTGLNRFRETFPSRFFDVGIAEPHAITFAAGLAANHFKPFVAIYSSFLQRAYDNVLHDAALQRLGLVLCIDRAGLSPADGPTHHGIYDVSLLNTVPEIEIYTPYTFEKLRVCLEQAYANGRLAAIRYPNGPNPAADMFTERGWLRYDFEGRQPKRIVITYGSIVREALAAKAESDFGIILLEKIKPYEAIAKEIETILPDDCQKIVFLEEGVYNGGAGMILKNTLHTKAPFEIVAIKDQFGEGHLGETLYETCGISKKQILEALK